MIKASKPAEVKIHRIRQSNRVRSLLHYSTKENTLAELKESIKTNGLICPIAVMAIPDTNPEEFVVIAGDRRRTCMQQLWEEGDQRFETVLCMVYPYTDVEADLVAIALFENVHRAQLTWQEKAAGIKQLHDLQTAIAGKPVPGPKKVVSAAKWTQADTAKFFGITQATVSRALEEAVAMENDPVIAKCKDRKDAVNIMMKKAEKIIVAEQARRQMTATASDGIDATRKRLSDAYVVSDAVSFLDSLKPASIGFLNLDWPWNINAIINKSGTNSAREMAAEEDALGVMTDAEYCIFMRQVLNACYRAMAIDSWIMVWFSSQNQYATITAVQECGFTMESLPAIWVKDTSTLSKLPDRRLNNGYEPFFYAWKGCPYIARRNRSNVFHYAQASGRDKVHVAEKPVALMQDIISTFAFPHMLVCDPFAGSGNALLAASNLNMNCCGCDKEAQHHDKYTLRVFEGRPGEYR